MERLDFSLKCADYLIGHILPMFIPCGGCHDKFASLFRWAKGGVRWAVALKIEDVIARREPMLRAFGIIDDNGAVSLDVLDEFLTRAFEAEEELVLPLSILGVEMEGNLKLDANDKAKLMEVLNG